MVDTHGATDRSMEDDRTRTIDSASADSSAEPVPGSTLDRFELRELLGRGGMGVVFRAHDPKLGREVALKLMRRATSDAESRFVREAQAMARLNHPNILPVFDFGRSEYGMYIAMQLVEGRTLSRWLVTANRSRRDILAKLVAAGRGLQAAHDADLVHRDFKASNVMVSREGRVLVMDFGLVRALSDIVISEGEAPSMESSVSGHLTETGAVLGSPPYMAPEQHLGRPTDVRSDQYSFCVTLWKALCGQWPFQAKRIEELLHAKVTDLPVPPRGRRVPRPLLAVLRRGLAPEPEDRFASMSALLEALQRRSPAARVALGMGATIGLTGLAMGVAGVGDTASPGDESVPCPEATERLDGIWDDASQRAVESAILDTKLKYAQQTWPRLRTTLDDYATHWVEGHADACTATHVRHEQDESVMDARMRCLNGRLRHFEALVDTLREADAGVVRRAVQVARDLPALDRCADPEHVAAQVPLPEDPDVREQVDAVDEQLARAMALEDAGKFHEGLAAAEDARATAQLIGYGPLMVHADMQVGSLCSELARYDEAVELLQNAYFGAERWGMERLRATAALHLVEVYDHFLEDSESAEIWAKHAKAEAERLGDPRLEGYRLGLQGAIEASRGDYDQAQRTLERTLEVLRSVPGIEPIELAPTMNKLANVYMDRRDYDRAQQLLERELAIREEALGPGHPATGVNLSNIGSIHLHRAELDEALPWFERALAIHEDGLGPDHPEVAGTLNNIAIIHGTRGRHDRALAAFERVLKIREATYGPDHPAVAASLNNIAFTHQSLERYDQALTLFERTLAIEEQTLGPSHVQLITTVTNIGGVHRALGDLERAVPYYRRALSLSEGSLAPDHPDVASALVNLGEVLREQGQLTESIEHLERALELRESGVATPAHSRGRTRFELARSLTTAGRSGSRAHALAQAAREDYAGAPGDRTEAIAAIDRWLAH